MKRKPTQARTLMERTRAAVAYVNCATRHGGDVEMVAFMALFHPDYPADKVRDLAREAKARRRV